jgi:adenylate cyclase
VQAAALISNVFISCGMVILIVYYAFREMTRAQETAEREYQRSESLLANMLPAAVAGRLKNRAETVIADKYDDASILFADMAGYTARASDTRPDDLVAFLNQVFTEFDRLVEQHGLEKIKTTGDAYVVVSGLPTPRPDQAEALACLALDLRSASEDLHDPYGRKVPIRMGMSCGPVVAGVGRRKFFYDVWGDAVNVASRMETTGAEGKIQVSHEAYERLKEQFMLEERGWVDIKGTGQMRTRFLVARK